MESGSGLVCVAISTLRLFCTNLCNRSMVSSIGRSLDAFLRLSLILADPELIYPLQDLLFLFQHLGLGSGAYDAVHVVMGYDPLVHRYLSDISF